MRERTLRTLISAVMLSSLCFAAAIQAQNYKTEYLTPTPKPAAAATATASAPAARSAATTATPAPLAPAKQKNINEIARFIAGLPPENDAQLAEFAKTPEWTAYANSMNSRWPRFEYIKLSQIRLWTVKELAKVRTNTVFYPFSGPDFIYASAYFPQASTYILCGLEPVGDIPSVEKLTPLANSLGWLDASFKTLFNAGYFVTSDMGIELKQSPLQGTLPLFCVMLARAGDHITSIAANAGRAEIRFTSPKDGGERVLYYFCTDLSNGGLAKSSFLGFLRGAKPDIAYVKSASYLMHEEEFATVRNFLLNQCAAIVQDDSGVPIHFFDPKRWTLKLYGSYHPPLDIFAKYNQPDLAGLYSKSQPQPLTFGVGYHWDYNDANLLLAIAKSGPAASRDTSAPKSNPRH